MVTMTEENGEMTGDVQGGWQPQGPLARRQVSPPPQPLALDAPAAPAVAVAPPPVAVAPPPVAVELEVATTEMWCNS